MSLGLLSGHDAPDLVGLGLADHDREAALAADLAQVDELLLGVVVQHEPGELDRGPNQDADGDQGQGQADDDGVRPNAEALRELGFAPVAVVRSEGPDARVVDLYRDGDRIVVAVDRTSGSTTVLTELVGFRVLVTTALLVPPTDELVVNVAADGDTPELVLSHQRLVRQAFRSRTLPSEPVGLFKLAQQRRCRPTATWVRGGGR